MSNDLVFQFKCLNGVADLNVHDFVSFFISRAVPRSGPCVPFAQGLLCPVRTRPIVSPTFFVCFSLSMNFFAVSCIFDFYGILYCCTSIIWVIPNKTVKKNKQKRRTPTFTSTLGTTKYSLKPGQAIALQIIGSLSDNKVSVFTNKSALHW